MTEHAFTRQNVSFASGDAACAAWLYFAEAGIAALAFTYRHFGDSEGAPRQLLSIKRQLADWEAALAYVQTRPELDRTRVAVWGSSFGGGHAITVAAGHPELLAGASRPDHQVRLRTEGWLT